jgi:hypothetical protein
MGAGGAQGKKKPETGDERAAQLEGEEEEMYTEDRSWTEGVVGNRPRAHRVEST